MPSLKIQSKYSCKRKKDTITFFALLMFFCMVGFEIYLIAVVPIQLRSKETFEKHVAKMEMLSHLDTLRQKVKNAPARNDAQRGERDLCKGVLDVYAMYVREHQDNMSYQQIMELQHNLNRYESIYQRWIDKPVPRFYIFRETIDLRESFKQIEAKTQNVR